MAQANANITTSRFHNLSNEALADEIGHADALLKGAEAECTELKEEFKRRGLLTVAGEQFTVTRSEQISGRLDVTAVNQYLGESWRRFEVATVSTVIRIKAVQRLCDSGLAPVQMALHGRVAIPRAPLFIPNSRNHSHVKTENPSFGHSAEPAITIRSSRLNPNGDRLC
jgi:hypothetical protein